jgi:hypothetical protein
MSENSPFQSPEGLGSSRAALFDEAHPLKAYEDDIFQYGRRDEAGSYVVSDERSLELRSALKSHLGIAEDIDVNIPCDESTGSALLVGNAIGLMLKDSHSNNTLKTVAAYEIDDENIRIGHLKQSIDGLKLSRLVKLIGQMPDLGETKIEPHLTGLGQKGVFVAVAGSKDADNARLFVGHVDSESPLIEEEIQEFGIARDGGSLTISYANCHGSVKWHHPMNNPAIQGMWYRVPRPIKTSEYTGTVTQNFLVQS